MTALPSNLPAPLLTHLGDLGALLARISQASLEALYHAILHAYQRDAQIFVVGNGGSAATATHFACDLGKNTRAHGQRRPRVISLTDNVAALTAWANDDGYAQVFVEQMVGLFNPHDLLIAISGSGNSPNVLAAVNYARDAGGHTVALTGFAGGAVAPRVEHALVVPCDRMELIEDAHLAVCHALTASLRAEIAAMPHRTAYQAPVVDQSNAGAMPFPAVIQG